METSAEDSGDKNKITVKFDAMMIPLPEVIVSNKMNESVSHFFYKVKVKMTAIFRPVPNSMYQRGSNTAMKLTFG